MKTFYTPAIAILLLLATSLSTMAQGIDTANKTAHHSDFGLGTGLLFGAMNSQVMLGAYLDAAIGEARIDCSIVEAASSSAPSSFFVNNNPEPSFNRISVTFGSEIVNGLASVVLAAGPAYTFGVKDGKYLYSTGFIVGTDYYEPIPFSRIGLALDADVDVPVSRHFAFGLRSSLTVDNVGSYGLFGMTFGYILN